MTCVRCSRTVNLFMIHKYLLNSFSIIAIVKKQSKKIREYLRYSQELSFLKNIFGR